jgi:hypothetical protein
MTNDAHPSHWTPEEWERIQTATARAETENYRLRAIREYLEPSPPPPPPPEPSPAEIRYREAVDWLCMKLAFLRVQEAAGNRDAGRLGAALLHLSHSNGLIWQGLDFTPPEKPRGKGRPADPVISARRHQTSRAIHAEIMRRLALALPTDPPEGEALTVLLDASERRIDEARQNGRRILTEAVETAIRPDQDPGRPLADYRAIRRRFLIQDLAAFIFADFLTRGGILGIPRDRPLYLPSFTLAQTDRQAARAHQAKAGPNS